METYEFFREWSRLLTSETQAVTKKLERKRENAQHKK